MPIPTLNWGAQKGFVDQIVDVAKHASGSTRLKNAQSMCPAEWCSSSYVRKIALRHVQNLPMEKHTVDCKTFPALCDCAQCAMCNVIQHDCPFDHKQLWSCSENCEFLIESISASNFFCFTELHRKQLRIN